MMSIASVVRGCSWLTVAAFAAGFLAARAEGQVSIRTDTFVLDVAEDGKVVKLLDKCSGKDYLPENVSCPFMRVHKEGRLYDVSSISLRHGLVTAVFDEPKITATFKLETKDEFATLELVSLSDTTVKYLEFARVLVAITENVATSINAAYDSQFAFCVMAGTPETQACFVMRRAKDVAPAARCWPEIAVQGVKAILIGCPSKDLKTTIGKAEVTYGLPHPTFKGVWAKESPEPRKGYLLINPSRTDIDKAIAYAERGGIPYIMFLSGSWCTSIGHYPINRKNFPRGEADLKATVDRMHSKGIKAGMHFLSACISKRDAYVTPVPDKRLHKDGELTLAESIDENSTFVATKEDPVGFLTESHYQTRGGVDIQIDDEIIQYAGISHEPPYGFTKCRRGAYKTKPAPHKAGAKVYHINQRYNMFLADPKTDLVDEIAERLAHVYNTCGFDMVYFDGGEAMGATGPAWYTVSLIHRAFFKRLKRDVLWQGSGSTHYSWHFFTRGNCDDYVRLDPKAYCDEHKTPRIERYYNPNFLFAELGWWGFVTHTQSTYATLPDEIEYMCARAVAWDAAVNLECHIGSFEQNGRAGEILDRMKIWQELQHSDYFPESVKLELRKKEMDFTLVKDKARKWRVKPVKYHPVHIADPKQPDSCTWKLNNEFSRQPIAARIRAMTEVAPYGSEGNIVLFDPKQDTDIGTTKSAGMKCEAAISTDQTKTGKTSCRFTATAETRSRVRWAEIVHRFDEPLRLSRHRALGLWVYGDGKGELLNVQLEDVGHRLRDRYIDIDFKGRRFVVVDQWDARRAWALPWPYNRKWIMTAFNFGAVASINFWLVNIEPGESAGVFIDRVEALKETNTALKRPKLTVGRNSVVVPVTMKPDEYVELAPDGKCRHFDPNGHLLRELRVRGKLPTVSRGENTIKFSAESNARARLTLMTAGDPLKM